MDETLTLTQPDDLARWEDACDICTKPFETGDSYRFISFMETTLTIDSECEQTLRSVIKELRAEYAQNKHKTALK